MTYEPDSGAGTGNVRPLFIFSASRSGSTLLQRIIGAHDVVATSSEPWILLPLLGSTTNIRAFDRWNTLSSIGIKHFADLAVGSVEAYRQEMVTTAMRLYHSATPDDAEYFLDKTPAYWYIVDEIIESFDDAKFVFLWRNPLAVIASCVETWEQGHWSLRNYRSDLFEGLPKLTEAYRRYSSRAFEIRYEDIVSQDSSALSRLFSYLEIDWYTDLLSTFEDVRLTGPLGDQTGVSNYRGLSRAPLEKWRHTICNPIRRAWCSQYLEWLGADHLSAMGYDLDQLQEELASTSMSRRHMARDASELGALAAREILTARRREGGAPSSWRRLLR